MKINWKKLLLCLALPLAVGGLAALLSGGMDRYQELDRPPLSPPGWVFPVVWSLLYLLMFRRVYRRHRHRRSDLHTAKEAAKSMLCFS